MSADMTFGSDEWLMDRALRYAKFGLGTVAPNPSVGAVVFDPVAREMVGVGWTQPGGRPHAEPVALDAAGQRTRGATMAVTLEPCVHFGRSPPCTNAIIAAGIRRVIFAIPDPDPRVAGKGAAKLRDAGIAVDRFTPAAAEEARWVTRGHILRVTERRPFVQVKIAVGADGRIAHGAGRTAAEARPTWVTGQTARATGHLLRAEADAIVVGTGTVLDDDPDLTCRLPGTELRSPIRIVIGERGVPANSRLLATADRVPVVRYARRSDHAPEEPIAEPSTTTGGSTHVGVATVGGSLWLPEIMEDLVGRGVTRLLVEGGPTLWAAFAKSRLVDEVVVFHAWEPDGKPSIAHAEHVVARYLPGVTVDAVDQRPVGRDHLFVFRAPRAARLWPAAS
ncbi:MAG: bifunctional diaminohydroxyphosphoribosylaminopyrimidine deaminase/5-amino-6-(5-phosphoribosylamino)uracil reductase RibD [Pseudomonadota bacterium]